MMNRKLDQMWQVLLIDEQCEKRDEKIKRR